MFKFAKISATSGNSIDEIRMMLLHRIIIFVNLIGIPAILIGAYEAFLLKQYFTALTYFIFFSPITIVTLYRKKIAYKYIALTVLIFIYLIAIFNVAVYGFSGAGLPVFISLNVLATLFFNTKAGLFTLLSCVFGMIVMAFLYLNNILSLGVSLDEISTKLVSWITAISVLALLGSMVVFGLGIIQNKMIQSIENSNLQSQELKIINEKLKEDVWKRKQTEEELRSIQNNLEKIVQTRTLELERNNKEMKANNEELERINNLFVDREFRITELKQQIDQLEAQVRELIKNT